MKAFIKNNKKIILSILIIACVIGSYCIYSQIKINNQIQQNITQIEKNKELKSNLDKVVNNYKNEVSEDNKNVDKQLADLDKYRLIVLDTKETNYSNEYHDVKITVKNVSSENVNYVKIGLDFLNENGEIVQSDWTNDDSIIKPNAQQTLTKRISNTIKYKTINAEIQEVK